MKKKLLGALLCAAAIIPLASCGNGEINSMLKDLRKGFKVTGTITQTAHWLDSAYGNPTGETDQNVYNITYHYQNTDIVGVTQNVTYYDVLNEMSVTMLDDTFIKGNDGFAYFYELGYENKLEAVAAVDSLGNSVNYAYYFDNPFSHIISSDFTHKEGNVYELDKSKAFYLSYILFNQIDTIFYEVCKSAEFTIENGTLKSARIEPIQIQDYATVGQQNRYYRLETLVEIEFSEAGKATIQTPELRESESFHTPLRNALTSIDKNYTLKATWNSNDYGEQTVTIVHTFYYADNDIYWQVGEHSSVDPINDVILRVDPNSNAITPWGYDDIYGNWSAAAGISNGYSQLVGAPVSDFRPVISDVAAEIFDFNGQTRIYSAADIILPYIAAECFVPPIIATTELNGYTTQCDIILENNSLKTINIAYSYNNGWDVYAGNYILEFSNIGSTTLPFGITL